MSMDYRMRVEIKDLPNDQDLATRLKDVVNTEWEIEDDDWGFWTVKDLSDERNTYWTLDGISDGSLSGGLTTGDVAQRIAIKVWKTVGRFVRVEFCWWWLDREPDDVDVFDDEHDYELIMKEEV